MGAARFGAPTVDDEPVGKVSKAEATALEADARQMYQAQLCTERDHLQVQMRSFEPFERRVSAVGLSLLQPLV